MKWLMLCREPRLYSCQRIKQACEAQGIELDILDPNRMLLQLSNGAFQLYYQAGEIYDKHRPPPYLLPEYKAVIPRFGTSSIEMGCNVLRHFEAKGAVVLNGSQAFRLARDKWQSLQALVAKGIAVPSSALAGELLAVPAQVAQFGENLVIKTLSGSQGVGVMLSENCASSQSILAVLKQARIQYLTQDFIQEAKGTDIRAFVIGNKVVAAMKRIGKESEFRSNLHLGGVAQAVELSEKNANVAISAAQAIGLDVAGVDLIESKNGLMVLEVNASPGLEGIEKATGKNIAEMMVSCLIEKREQL